MSDAIEGLGGRAELRRLLPRDLRARSAGKRAADAARLLGGAGAAGRRSDGTAGRRLCVRRSRHGRHDAGESRCVSPLADRPAHAAPGQRTESCARMCSARTCRRRCCSRLSGCRSSSIRMASRLRHALPARWEFRSWSVRRRRRRSRTSPRRTATRRAGISSTGLATTRSRSASSGEPRAPATRRWS